MYRRIKWCGADVFKSITLRYDGVGEMESRNNQVKANAEDGGK